MWHVLFSVLGTVARLGAASRALDLWQGRGQARFARGRRRGTGRNSPLAVLPDLTGNRLSGAGVAAAVETGRAMLNRPSVRASLEGAVPKLLGGTGEQSQSIEAVREAADRTALILHERSIVPSRIGVDGLPGSGKSALSRALAETLGMKWKSLDHENMNAPLDFAPQGTIYEHHRLFRTQDVDHFDAIIYVDEPVEVSKARVLRRAKKEARQGLIIDVVDYDKLKEIGKFAFDLCEGEPISIPGTRLLMKLRPPAGFRAVENTVSRLHAAGHETEGLGKEAMLFLLVYGRPQSGLTAYFQPGAYNEELLRGLLAGMRTYVAGQTVNRSCNDSL